MASETVAQAVGVVPTRGFASHYKQSPGLRVHLWPLRMLQGGLHEHHSTTRVVENLLRGASGSLSDREEAKRASQSFGLGESFKPRCSMYGLFTFICPKSNAFTYRYPQNLPTFAYIYPCNCSVEYLSTWRNLPINKVVSNHAQ